MSKETLSDSEMIIRQLPDPLLIFSKTGEIITASKAFEDISGYTLEEVVGKNAFTYGLICKESIPTVKKNLLRRFFGQKIPLYDVAVRIKDGTILIAEVNGAVIDFKGKKAVLTIFRDVTAKRQQTEENNNKLREATQKLQEKLTELEKMNELMVGRELRMVELKDKLEKLDR